ncbi:Glucose-induced degradation complex subunit [Globodera pallida]|nr:Glucose-induced degradation complex subunit [Globodera pallida]
MSESDELFGHLPPLSYSVKEEEFDSDSTWFNLFMDEASEDFDSNKLHELVVEYLVFSGYKEAAEMLVEDAELPSLNTTAIATSKNVDTLEKRNAIRNAVISGSVESALFLVNEIAPTLLGNNATLHFKLLRQQLVELIRNKNVDQVLNFSQQNLVDKCKEIPAELFAKLEQTYALLAFDSPENSPFGYLMCLNQRNILAYELNEAILAALHKPCVSRLEQLYRLMVWNQHHLKTKNDGTKLTPEVVEEWTMDFGGLHSNFVPHSPLSYSTSYSPMSPLKDQQIKCVNEIIGDLGKENVGAAPPNKSILKNPTTLFFKEQQKKLLKSAAEASVDSAKKLSDSQTARKETLKTVAFGLTTRLENTVLANQSKVPTSSTAKINKTLIFSHEAQSLHKIVVAQEAEIAELRGKVDDLIEADDQHRCEEREQMNIIADLSTRLMMVERTLASSTSNDRGHCEENRERSKALAVKRSENGHLMEEEDKTKERLTKTSVGKRMVLKQRQLNNENSGELNAEVECIRSQQRTPAFTPIDEAPAHRNDILQRLDQQMRKNPHFENRIKSMLRVWTDDVASPVDGTSILEYPREESGGGGTSMVVRVTTQHQELFYSSSPGRNRKVQPITRRQKLPNQPIVTELSDNGVEEQLLETVPNVRRSDHCTDDAEFFQNEDDQLDDDNGYCAGEVARNLAFNQQPFRRRKREATLAIRNKYK